MFADDTSMASTYSVINDLQGILNHDLEMILTGQNSGYIVTFNPNKTEVLYFGNQQPPDLVKLC